MYTLNGTEDSHALDSWWQESTGETKGDVEKISRAGVENTRTEMGTSDEVGCGHNMCDPTHIVGVK